MPKSERSGDLKDRAVEWTIKLLKEGFPVRVLGDDIREQVASSDYKERQSKWITTTRARSLCLEWSKEDYLFHKASSLPDAHWMKGKGMYVPVSSWKEILDFAETHGFNVSG